ncbi:MAG: hypothetical protein IE927_12710 [Rhodobacterales bacterium]|nr:hypothetical protein [Rhodobacterales bacterium]
MKFAIGIHNHQPVGNFDHVVEEAYQQSYWPFLQAFARHEGLKLNLHNSGPVWEFVRAHHPEYISLVKKLIASGRLELLTGGYYEPILPIILVVLVVALLAFLWSRGGEQPQQRVEKVIPAEKLGQ